MRASSPTSLRVRLIQLVLLAVLPALALILYSAAEQRRLARTSAEGEALRAARVLAVGHERLIDSTRHLLVALSRLIDIRNGDSRDCNLQLGELIKEYPLYTNLGLARLNGDVVCSGRPLAKRLNIADRSYFQRSLQTTGFAIGEYHVGRISGRASLTLAYPFFDDGGEVHGIVYAGLDLASFNQIVAAAQLPSTYTLTVLDRQNTILARHPDHEQWLGKRVVGGQLLKNTAASGEGIVHGSGPDGKEHLFGFVTLGDSSRERDLHISISIPTEVALSEANRVLKRNLTALLLACILALAAAWFGGEMFVLRHLNALVTTTEKIGMGDLGARSGLPHSSNEIGRLAASLDRMAATLQRQRAEAAVAREQVQRNLERTRALREMDLAIASTLDLRTMLDLLLEKIDVVLPGAVTTVRLLNKESGELEPIACRNIDENAWRAGNPKSSSQGFAKLVLASRQPLTIANAQTDPRNTAHQFARSFGLVSYHGVPLIAKDELLGIIAFYTKEGHSFSREEIEFLTTLAGQLSLAIHNAKLYEAARRSEGEISALHSLTIAATQSLDLAVVLKEAIQKVTEILRFDATRVFLFNEEMTELHVQAAFESRPECWNEAIHFQRGESIVGRVADTGESFIFEDIVTDARYLALTQTRSSLKAQARFLGMFPIKTKLKIWGAMVCVGLEPRKLDPAEVTLLQSMTHQIGIAVENATLYQQTATKARELSALYAIAAIGSESLDIKTVLEKTMRKVLQIFGFDAARIFLRQEATGELELVVHAGIPADIALIERYRPGQGRLGRTLETGEPMIVEDMQTDPIYNQTAHSKVMLRAGFRSSFLIPIKVRQEALGVMNFLGREPHQFSESDHQLINSMAYHMGIAVGNANLFSQIRQKTEELEKANRGKDEFLGVVSHELRTPLNVIKGYTELMRTEAFGRINAEQHKALEKIVSQTQDLLGMIDHVLQVTTIQAGAAKVNYGDVNLCDLLDELQSNYVIPNQRKLVFEWSYSRDLPVIMSDEEKLKAVIQNLINNAVKFTEKGSIKTFVQELAGGAIEIKVADSGVGIPTDQLRTIFEMFEQVDSSTTRKHGGIGLGLYIVKTFTDLLGGRVEVESELGRGSVFTVTLPMLGVVEQAPSATLSI